MYIVKLITIGTCTCTSGLCRLIIWIEKNDNFCNSTFTPNYEVTMGKYINVDAQIVQFWHWFKKNQRYQYSLFDFNKIGSITRASLVFFSERERENERERLCSLSIQPAEINMFYIIFQRIQKIYKLFLLTVYLL